jgi:hypothetical protein
MIGSRCEIKQQGYQAKAQTDGKAEVSQPSSQELLS